MQPDPHTPPEGASLEELSGPLRRAVEHIRGRPLPRDAADRALRRARQLAVTENSRQRRMALLALAAIAATVLAAVALWPRPDRNRGPDRRALAHGTSQHRTEGRRVDLEPRLENPQADRKEDSGEERGKARDHGQAELKPKAKTLDDTGSMPAGAKPDYSLKEEKKPGEITTLGAQRNLMSEPRPSGQPKGEGGDSKSSAPAQPAPTAPRGYGGGEQGGTGSGAGKGGMPLYRRGGMPSGPGSAGGRFTAPQTPSLGTYYGRSAATKESAQGGQGGKDGKGEADRFHFPARGMLGPGPRGAMGPRSGEDEAPANKKAPARLSDRTRDLQKRLEERNKDVGERTDARDPYLKDKGKVEGESEGKQATKGKEKKEKEATKRPQVWRRRNERPTFARVYVGDGNALELVSLQVTVTIEGSRARTLVDHIFRNPHDQQLEGTFEYPLPTGASPSYFAMFLGQTRDTPPPRFRRHGKQADLPPEALRKLQPAEVARQVASVDWGRLQEARVVGKQKALETYEEVVRGRIDPALLEYAGGNTFRGRVFPIPPRGYNRVLIAYEELLPCVGDRVRYQFPLPNRPLHEVQLTLQANAADCTEPAILPREVKPAKAGDRLVYTHTWKDADLDGSLVFAFTPPRPHIQAISGRQDESGPVYLYARVRPELKQVEGGRPFADTAVFLLDTSLSEYPDRFDVNVKLLRKILAADASIRRFNILTFNAAAAWVEPKGWLPNTAAGRKQALDRLDGLVLEGATDLSAALDKLCHPGFDVPDRTPLNVFLLSDGQVTWGETEAANLAARFESRCPYPCRFHCYRTGLGAENLELFEALTRRGGGVFNCFTEADLAAAAVAHRKECLRVERVRLAGGPAASDVLVAGRRAAVYPGGELLVAARLQGAGRTTLVVEGTFLGKKYAQEYPVEVKAYGELAPRGWGEIAVNSLLALNDPKYDSLVTAYCQQFNIGSRVASFLVLENEADYKRLNLQEERGKTVPGDLAEFLETVWKDLGKVVPSKAAFERFLAQIDPRVNLLHGANGPHVRKLLDLLKDKDFELPEAHLRGALVHKGDVPAAYLAALAPNPGGHRDVAPFLTETRRRADAGDVDGAIRALSGVIEEYPDRGDALRLVGYRLLDLKQAGQAVRLFERVQRQRPFEPHSYRDLARSLEEAGRYGLAAIQYEILLAGTWHARFHDSLKEVALEEYAHMMQEAIRHKAVGKALANHFGDRLERLARPQPKSDLRVTISWNTDATDVDLWVIEPDGTKCYFQNTRTPSGGELSQDQTQGYGPERYQIAKAKHGVYTVIVHYFSPNPNLLAGETHVNVVVTRHAGSPQEKVERHTVILKRHDQQVEVCKVKF